MNMVDYTNNLLKITNEYNIKKSKLICKLKKVNEQMKTENYKKYRRV